MPGNFRKRKESSVPDDPVSELKKTVNALTKNSDLLLDKEKMKKIKDLCKSSQDNIPHLYHFLMTQLRKERSEVRYIMLLAINEFFMRSHSFRKMLESDFEEFLELTLETVSRKPLPPPKPVAERLKAKAVYIIKEWHRSFGAKYNVVKNAYTYLRSCKKIDFGRDNSEPSHSDERSHLRYSGMTQSYKTRKEMEERYEEIFSTLTQIERCFQMLLPLPDDLFNENDLTDTGSVLLDSNMAGPSHINYQENSYDCAANSLRHHGILNRNTVVSIELNKMTSFTVTENAATEPVIESLREMCTKVRKVYLPMVSNWLKVFSEESNCDNSVKKATDLKDQLESKLAKYEKLKQNIITPLPADEDNDLEIEESDSDFEEVIEKEGYEATVHEPEDTNISSKLKKLSSGSSLKSMFESADDKNECVNDLYMPSTSSSVPDWQDPVLLAELESTTGVNLKMPEKKQKNKQTSEKTKQKKSKIKKSTETTQSRLEKKLRKLKKIGKK